jgi:hypothetical protein
MRVKILIPDHVYLTILGQINFWRGNYESARKTFQEVLLEKPKYYTLDSLIKATEFLENVDDKTLKYFNESITGTYLNEKNDQIFHIKYDNESLGAFWEGQVPHPIYPMDQNSIYYCPAPYNDRQHQVRQRFEKGIHGQILKVIHVQQNSPNQTPSSSVYFKTTSELQEALTAFKQTEYNRADSLFQIVYKYDTGYYFVRNFIDAIKFSSNNDAQKLAKLLRGKHFKSEKYERALDFSYNDDVFQFNTGNDVPHTIYPLGDNWIMDAYRKRNKFKVSRTGDKISIEFHMYNHDSASYQFMDTYRLVN